MQSCTTEMLHCTNTRGAFWSGLLYRTRDILKYGCHLVYFQITNVQLVFHLLVIFDVCLLEMFPAPRKNTSITSYDDLPSVPSTPTATVGLSPGGATTASTPVSGKADRGSPATQNSAKRTLHSRCDSYISFGQI